MNDYQYNPNLEQWKEIPDFPGYEVSDHGRIRSYLKYVGACKWEIAQEPQRILKPAPSHNGKGYLFVRLSVNGMIHYRSIHTVVLISFMGLPPKNCECLHNDNNKLNNHLINLSWGTHKQNCKDRSRQGTSAIGETHPSAKLTKDKVIKIRYLASTGLSQSALSKLFGTNQSNIGAIIHRHTWKHI